MSNRTNGTADSKGDRIGWRAFLLRGVLGSIKRASAISSYRSTPDHGGWQSPQPSVVKQLAHYCHHPNGHAIDSFHPVLAHPTQYVRFRSSRMRKNPIPATAMTSTPAAR